MPKRVKKPKRPNEKWIGVRFTPEEQARLRIAAAHDGQMMGPWLHDRGMAAVERIEAQFMTVPVDNETPADPDGNRLETT